jgi:gliding motility-associated-like protein
MNLNGAITHRKQILYNNPQTKFVFSNNNSYACLASNKKITLFSYFDTLNQQTITKQNFIIFDSTLNLIKKVRASDSNMYFFPQKDCKIREELLYGKYYIVENDYQIMLIDTSFSEVKTIGMYSFNGGEYGVSCIIQNTAQGFNLIKLEENSIIKLYYSSNFRLDSSKIYFLPFSYLYQSNFGNTNFYKNKYLSFVNQDNSQFSLFYLNVDSLEYYYPSNNTCYTPYMFSTQLIANNDVTINNVPLNQFPNEITNYPITTLNKTKISYPYQNQSYSCHSAHFTLPKDTFCINEILNLYSDTCVKQGNSYWKIRYATDSQESWDYKFENIALLQKGVAYISHTHELAGCVQSHLDTIFIQDSSGIASLDLGKDTTFCGSSVSLKLDAYNANFSSYLWNTGSHDSAILALAAGTYWVRATSACGTLSDTLHITDSQAPSLSIFAQDTLALCPLQFPYTLYTGIITNDSKDFLWNTGSTMPFIEVNNSGKYWVSVKSGCHIWNDTVFVKQKDTLLLPSYPDSFKLCKTTMSLVAPQGLFLEVYINNNWQSFLSFPLTSIGKITYRWRDSCNRVWQKNMVIWKDTIPILFPKNAFVYCEPIFQKNPEIQNTNPQYKIEKWQNNQWNFASSYTMNVGNTIYKTSDTCGNYRLDTVVGIYQKQTLALFNIDSIVLCPSQLPYRIAIVDTFKNYRWQYWNEPNYYMATVEGMHYIEVTDSCYVYSDSVFVRLDTPQIQNLNLPNNVSFCVDTIPHTVSALGGFSEYIWNRQKSNQATYSFRYPLSILYLQVPRACDTLRDTTRVAWTLPDTTSPKIKIDSTQCESMAGIQLSLLNASAFKRFEWQNGATEPTILVNQKDSILLKTYNTCFDHTWRFEGKYCQPFPIGLPSAFSPNGDNKNDVFKINGNLLGITILEMKIFNRWGECVYAVYNNFPNWDGTYKNTPLSAGTYIYFMRYSYVSSPQIIEIKGSLNLMK